MACIADAVRGAGSYTVIKFFRDHPGLAATSVMVASILAPITMCLSHQHIRRIQQVPEGSCPEDVRRWYTVLATFPLIAAISCWMGVVFPNLSIAFEVVYVCYEAACLLCFGYVLLRLSRSSFAGYVSSINSKAVLRECCQQLSSKEDPTYVQRRILYVYQFVVLGPLFEIGIALCEYAELGTLYSVFSLSLLLSTILAVFNLLLLWCRLGDELPHGTNVHRKFFVIKGMVFISNIQNIIIGLVIQCGHSKSVFDPAIAQNVWRCLVFLVQLPLLQYCLSLAYPDTDLTALFMTSDLDEHLGSLSIDAA